MNHNSFLTPTNGEQFYNITNAVKDNFSLILKTNSVKSGVLHLFNPHTSCGLLISESFDPSAAADLEMFMKHLAPRDLPFITHTAEGNDDSPSHMKNLVLCPTLTFIVENSEIVLGQWQGIYLCEFRDGKNSRRLHLKFQPDFIEV